MCVVSKRRRVCSEFNALFETRDVACLYMIGQTSLPGRVGRRLEDLGVPSSPVPASTTVTSGNILLKQF